MTPEQRNWFMEWLDPIADEEILNSLSYIEALYRFETWFDEQMDTVIKNWYGISPELRSELQKIKIQSDLMADLERNDERLGE